jgi:hypothetical protein
VAPSYGQKPQEYLSKLGRVYLDRPPDAPGKPSEPWSARFGRLLQALEERERPDVVLLDSRNGLHDVAAAAVMDVQAQMLLFAVDSQATWGAYRMLLEHWKAHEVVTAIRERLSLVAALVPELETEDYLERFRERAWDLFRESLYDEVPAGDAAESDSDLFSFDFADEDAPHNPLPVYWNRGLAARTSLRALEDSILSLAYGVFLNRFDQLWGTSREGAE